MTVHHFYSPSQIETFLNGCQRKWVFETLLGMPKEQSKSAALGDATHKILENYLKGRPITYETEAGYIASALTEILPTPEEFERNGGLVEQWIGYGYKGFSIRGRLDWTMRGDPLPIIGDHKTTGSPKYMKTPEILKKDIQATCYAYDGMSRYRVPEVQLFWGYVTTKKPYRATPVKCVRESTEVVQEMKRIHETALIPMSQLLHHKRENKKLAVQTEHVIRVVDEVQPNPSHCDAFGGCPYKASCTDIGPLERLTNSMGKFLDNMKSKVAAETNTETTTTETKATPPPPPQPADMPKTAPKDDLNPPAEEQAAQPTAADMEQKEAAAAKKGGRKKKSDKEAAVEDAGAKGKLTLYVNCLPLGTDAGLNTNRLMTAARAIANEKLGVVDYRLKPFGEGPAYFANTVAALVESGEYGNEIVVDTGTPEGQIILNPLLELAGKNVVRGLR